MSQIHPTSGRVSMRMSPGGAALGAAARPRTGRAPRCCQQRVLLVPAELAWPGTPARPEASTTAATRALCSTPLGPRVAQGDAVALEGRVHRAMPFPDDAARLLGVAQQQLVQRARGTWKVCGIGVSTAAAKST